uniref:Uncharacterized protein n=1 Tax=Panagrolaimus sp. JU765 TaxID=591449 RepID=A0AC34QG61_9BILA
MSSRAELSKKFLEKTSELDELRREICDLIEDDFESKVKRSIKYYQQKLYDIEFDKLKNVKINLNSFVFDADGLTQKIDNYIEMMKENKKKEEEARKVNGEVNDKINQEKIEANKKLEFLVDLGYNF